MIKFSRRNTGAFYGCLFSLFLCSLTACKEEGPKLSRSHNKIIDSLTQDKRIGIREELDSLCDILFAAEIDRIRDSIVEERMSEIRRKIEADAKKQ